MSSLIDSLSQDRRREESLQNVNQRNSSEAIEHQRRMERLKEAISNHFGKERVTNSQVPCPLIPSSGFKDSTTGSAAALRPCFLTIEVLNCEYTLDKFYRLHTRAVVQQRSCSIRIESMLLKDGVPFIVRTKKLRLMLIRYLHKLNSTLRDGFFRVNPVTGWITFSIESLFSIVQFWELVYRPKQCIKLIEAERILNIRQLKFNSYKILHLVDEVSEEQLEFLNSTNVAYRRVKNDFQTIITIRNALTFSHQPNEFMRHHELEKLGLSTFIPDGKLEAVHQRHSEFQNQVPEGFEIFLPEYLTFYNMISSDGEYTTGASIHEQFPPAKIVEFVNFLKIPVARTANPNQKNEIYNQIHVVAPELVKWEPIGEGGFSTIERAEVTIIYMDQATAGKSPDDLKKMREKHIKKCLVRKVEKTQEKGKISHEKKILARLQRKNCAHIAKFYFSLQSALDKVLLMDYCPGRSLEGFIRNNEITLTPATLIYLMYQATQSLRFLAVCGIQHLDVKPPNMLIARNLLLRLTDFGESYHPEVCSNGTKQLTQIITQDLPCLTLLLKYSPAIDVFSFGQVQHQVIFQRFPYDVSKRAQDKLRLQYRGMYSSLLSLIVPQKAGNMGPRIIMEMLESLSLRSMQKKPDQRPMIDWNVIILRQAFSLMDRMY